MREAVGTRVLRLGGCAMGAAGQPLPAAARVAVEEGQQGLRPVDTPAAGEGTGWAWGSSVVRVSAPCW